MLDVVKDFVTKIISSSSSVLLLDAPRRSIYGAVLGLFLEILADIATWSGVALPTINTYEYIVIGLVALHIRPLFEMAISSRNVSEKYEEQLTVIRQARKSGLSQTQTSILLRSLCEKALEEASLSQQVREQLVKKEESDTKED